MELMTHEMSEVAYKTKTETVSMKIITLVTLFFLPGTFVSVGCFFLLSLVGVYYPVQTLSEQVSAITTLPPQISNAILLHLTFERVAL